VITVDQPRAGRVGGRIPPGFPLLACLALAVVVLPLLGLLQRAAWSDFWADITTPEARAALRLSIVSSLSAAALAGVLGVPLAWMLARVPFPGRSFVRALVLLPMVLPPVVGGVALAAAFSRRGLVGESLYDWFGWQLTFSSTGVILAETFVALPFFVITVEGALRSMDTRFEDVARSMGARPWTVLRRVTLPLVAPALAAGLALAWARALGEFGATITFAGNIEGRTRTMPLAVYLLLEGDREAAIALSLVLLGVSLAVLVALRDRWLRTGGSA
jgi:molybdate transport system permease protein